jgi:hypothetical protein
MIFHIFLAFRCHNSMVLSGMETAGTTSNTDRRPLNNVGVQPVAEKSNQPCAPWPSRGDPALDPKRFAPPDGLWADPAT